MKQKHVEFLGKDDEEMLKLWAASTGMSEAYAIGIAIHKLISFKKRQIHEKYRGMEMVL